MIELGRTRKDFTRKHEWIIKVVESCENIDQLDVAERLVNNYYTEEVLLVDTDYRFSCFEQVWDIIATLQVELKESWKRSND